jgi:serine/threonine-protein kinase
LVQQVVGLSYSEAQKALASEGLAASRSDIDSAKPAGQVIGQDPPANASVPPGTTVKLQVANGKVKLPDVTKLTEQQARMKLNQLGFTTIARSNTAPVQPGYQVGQVMAVDPTPGIYYDPSTTITLTVAVKPACPSPSSSPSVTPSSSPSGSGTPSATPSKSSTAASSPAAPSSNPSCSPG